MAISKIVYHTDASDTTGTTWMDVTPDTVTSSKLLSGETATDASGTQVTGNIATKSSSNMTVSGATVTAPAGYYASNASKSVSSGSATTPATTVTANPTISVNSSTGLITATTSATKSVTPTVSAGYVSSGTAGTITVSGSNTNQLTVQAAQTIHPSTTDQTISSGKYLTGAQTIKAVVHNLTADKIAEGFVAKIGDSIDDDCVASITGTHSGGGGGSGLVYEMGTWVPTSDTASPSISFTNTHTSPPFFAMIADETGTLYTGSVTAILGLGIWVYEYVFGDSPFTTASTHAYGRVHRQYRDSSTSGQSGTNLTKLNDSTSSSSVNYYLTTDSFTPIGSSSQYYISGRTYKWVAVWPPTT